jgi:hypothetical protein
MRKSSKSIFGSPFVARLLVLVAALGSVACEPSNIRPCRSDLKPEVRQLISETYGADAIPKRSQFGALELLRSRFGYLVPYHCQLDFNRDGLDDFVSLLFVSGEVLVVIAIANSDGGYDLQKVATGFPVRPDGENETYLLVASPGRHYAWDGSRVNLTGSGFYFGTLRGDEYLLYWNENGLKRLLSRD